MSTDYRQLQIGDQTTQGDIKYIYGAAEDFIVFLNDKDDPKVYSERTDNVYNKVCEKAQSISAMSFKKLSKVQIRDVNDHLSGCMVAALHSDVKEKDLNRLFKPVVKFIKSIEKTKHVIARGPNPQHIVFVSQSNRVGWEVAKPQEYVVSLLSRITVLKQLSNSSIPSMLRESVSMLIGAVAMTAIRSKPDEDISNQIDHVENVINLKIKEYKHMLYAASALFFTLIAVILFNFFGGFENEYYIGMIGGAVGALISVLQRTDASLFSIYESSMSVLAQSLYRITIGVISGLIIVAASHSNIAFGLARGLPEAIFIFGITAGLTERWIPDFLTRVVEDNS